MELVLINGKKSAAKDAKISIFDRGFLYGDQCCETMRAYNGKIFKLERHLKRLENSLSTLKIQPIDIPALEKQTNQLLTESELPNAFVRISVSRGNTTDGFRFTGQLEPNVMVIVKEYHPLPYDYYSQGVTAAFSGIKRFSPDTWPLNVKNINLNNVLASLEASEANAYEAVMLNSEGYVTEGSTTNVFWVKEDELYTPADYLGILPGTTREVVLELAAEVGIRVNQGEFFQEELTEAEEAFLTNSLIEILPISTMDGRQLHHGTIGRITSILRESYHNLISAETF